MQLYPDLYLIRQVFSQKAEKKSDVMITSCFYLSRIIKKKLVCEMLFYRIAWSIISHWISAVLNNQLLQQSIIKCIYNDENTAIT